MFFRDIYSHSILGKPKRSSWDIKTTLVVAALHAIRSSFRNGGLKLWRSFASIPYHLSNTDQYHSASFKVKKLGLPGILSNFDSYESGTREIDAHWLLPLEESKNDEGKIVFYLHGGGYCAKDWQAYYTLTQQLSKYTKRPVFSLNYRLAPETRFPGALVDAFQGYNHLITEYKINPKDIAIVGDSAGGGLAMALLVYLRDHAYPLPETSILISPWVDLTYSHQSWVNAEGHDYLPSRPDFTALMNPARFYLGPEQYYKLGKHPYASPLFMEDYDNLPPILIQSGGSETMTDEVRTFADKFIECRNTMSKHEEYEDMIHDFQAYPLSKSDIAFSNIQKWVTLDIKQPRKPYSTHREII
ncbi:alpha/beta hydrolase fold-domain-containing protein [Helicostylum pulchrum]|nr:alpha/beta hydrolase fold-domain-containing protein [Helicostylum pulchrum]